MNMSFPNIPNVTPTISISREEAINLLLASIAFEELGLAHIINAEAEKIQAVVGTLQGVNIPNITIADLIDVNSTVNKMLKTVIKKEMLLQFKLEDLLTIPGIIVHSDTATVTATFDGETVTDSDSAFYHTESQ
jgi:hypothetical protein